MMVAPDGFALNLEAVALRLCAPFCRPPAVLENSETKVHPKLLSVDPSFCVVETGPFVRGGLHKLTCLLPAPSEEAAAQVKLYI